VGFYWEILRFKGYVQLFIGEKKQKQKTSVADSRLKEHDQPNTEEIAAKNMSVIPIFPVKVAEWKRIGRDNKRTKRP